MISLSLRREMVSNQDPDLSIVSQCELLGIHRSGLYYTPATESEENLQIMTYLDKSYLETPFYGVERLLCCLVVSGFKINRKRLRRLMKLVGWQTLYPQAKTTQSDPTHYKYPYLLKDIVIERVNQVWAIDITYIPMHKGFMYLFAIIDIHTRYVVGWSLSNTMTAQWCVQTIEQAIEKHGKPEIINSDQGRQFTSQLYIDCLKGHDIRISMDGKGRAIDNIFIERLWRSVKYEHVYLFVAQDGQLLWEGLHKYFRFYNRDRPHQSLKYKTPQECYLVAA